MDAVVVLYEHDARTTTMRKRKRGYGEYVDEDTGEVSIVQTTKQVKRNHQKTGKWYKEPTEAELRIWERDEKRQAAVDKAQRREDNKKFNAAKRAEKEEKEQELKRQEFEAGRISFTQTLAKKDEDQLNLHSWFGGRPKASMKQQQRSISLPIGPRNAEENKEGQKQSEMSSAASRVVQAGRIKQDSESCVAEEDPEPPIAKGEISEKDNMDLQDLDSIKCSQEFDIAEDSDADTEILEVAEEVEQRPEHVFKVPALPKRLPLSPMSKSDVNVRASQTTQVSSLKGKLEKASVSMPSSTQNVRDLLSGLCTQDLVDGIDGDNDEPFVEDKENQNPDHSSQATSEEDFIKDPSPCRSEPIKSAQMNRSFDSCDYDTIFAELDDIPQDQDERETKSNDFASDLKDADLLSLPSTQLLPSTKSFKIDSTKQTPTCQNIPTEPTRKPLKKNDSFAIEGLSEDDLEELYDQFEKHEQNSARASAASSFATSSTTPSFLKQGRVLPWEKLQQPQAIVEEDEPEQSQVYD